MYLGIGNESVYNITGIFKTDLNELEYDVKDPSFEYLEKLSQLYDVSMDWIITGDDFKSHQVKSDLTMLEHWKNRAEESELKLKHISKAFDIINQNIY